MVSINGEFSRNHRTALVLSNTGSESSELRERQKRLMESVNGSNIKVDFFTFDGSSIRPGKPGEAKATSSVSGDSIAAALKAAGYTQVVVAQ